MFWPCAPITLSHVLQQAQYLETIPGQKQQPEEQERERSAEHLQHSFTTPSGSASICDYNPKNRPPNFFFMVWTIKIIIQNWKHTSCLHYLSWSAQSSDLNSTEHLWEPDLGTDLTKAVEAEWEQIRTADFSTSTQLSIKPDVCQWTEKNDWVDEPIH